MNNWLWINVNRSCVRPKVWGKKNVIAFKKMAAENRSLHWRSRENTFLFPEVLKQVMIECEPSGSSSACLLWPWLDRRLPVLSNICSRRSASDRLLRLQASCEIRSASSNETEMLPLCFFLWQNETAPELFGSGFAFIVIFHRPLCALTFA